MNIMRITIRRLQRGFECSSSSPLFGSKAEVDDFIKANRQFSEQSKTHRKKS